jgi:hypothetical protein
VLLAGELNFLHAAEKAKLSLDVVGHSIQVREKESGLHLFCRGMRKVSITASASI